MTMFNWSGASGGGSNGGGAGSRWRDLVPSRYADQIAATVRPWTERSRLWSGDSQQWARDRSGGLPAPALRARLMAGAARMAGLSWRARTPAAGPAVTPLRRLGRLAAATGCMFAAGVLLGASGGMGAAAGTLIALAGLAAVGAAARMLWPLLTRGG
jgi:hypothetical protein